jgi:hypothetical protein
MFDSLKTLLKNNIRQYGMIIALISIMIFFSDYDRWDTI